ncbi:MAG TPA: PQQ-dependent sugar dehydrogenase [Candidatus Dormibacteraeota bacterium]
MWTRLGAVVLLATVAGCSSGSVPPKASAARTAAPAASASPTSQALKAPGPFHYTQSTVAGGLTAPWALDFAKDGSIWLTERPGRVRVIRNGQLLPDPALSLNVYQSSGCEGGLLGLVLKEPYAYLDYTYSGSAGPTDKVVRYTIQGDQLVNEQVLLDGIPGGSCYHDGGRIKFGPDGWLYITTGEGFVASRAADANNLAGKILRIHEDGSGREIYAWGFRNPQGLAWDAAGHLYVSGNGPTGDLGLCCHDELDQVQQGAFYGWPAWAGNVRTSYPQGSLPQRLPTVAESGNDTWAPSGMTFYAAAKDERPTLFLAELKGQALRRFVIDPADPGKVTAQEVVLGGVGRLRDAEAGPDGCLYVVTSNRDGRGSPQAGDDHVFKLCPS